MKVAAGLICALITFSCQQKKFTSSAAPAGASPSPIPSPSPSIATTTPAAATPSPTPTPVAEVAVNYDDGGIPGTTADFDYNDSVLCFKMKGTINGTDVKSLEEQNITAILSHLSGCAHRFEINVVSEAGVTEFNYSYTSDTNYKKDKNRTLQIPFKKGSVLKVRGANIINETDPNISNNCIEARKVSDPNGLAWYEMSNSNHFQVSGNCNLTGN